MFLTTFQADHGTDFRTAARSLHTRSVLLCLWFVFTIVGCAAPAVSPADPHLSPATMSPVQSAPIPPPTQSSPSPETIVAPAPPPSIGQEEPSPVFAVITALATVNLRIGPGLDYAIAGQLGQGITAKIDGRSPDGDWWLVIDPAKGRALWVTADPELVAAEGVADVTVVPVLPTPAAPIPLLAHEVPHGANTIAFSPDSDMLAIGAMDYTVRVYDTASWTLLWQAAHRDYVEQVLFSPDGQYLASAGFDGAVNLWEAATGRPRYRLEHGSWAVGPDFSADSLFVASGAADGKAVIAKTNDGAIAGEYVNALPIRSLALSPDGPWLAVMMAGSWGPVELAVWDIFTHERRVLDRFEGLPNQSNVVFSPNTQWLAASLESSGPLRVWKTQIWSEVAQLDTGNGHVQQISFSPDGRWLAALVVPSTLDTTVRLWSVPDWRPVSTVMLGDWALDMTISPDGNLLATAHGQGEPPIPPADEGRLWSVPGGELVARLPHMLQVQGLAFSPDGRWIATGGVDGTTKVWALPSP